MGLAGGAFSSVALDEEVALDAPNIIVRLADRARIGKEKHFADSVVVGADRPPQVVEGNRMGQRGPDARDSRVSSVTTGAPSRSASAT